MAREAVGRLIDDLDGGPAARTVYFSLDGVDYEIDLGHENARALRALFQPYLVLGRRVAPERRPRGPASTRARRDRVEELLKADPARPAASEAAAN